MQHAIFKASVATIALTALTLAHAAEPTHPTRPSAGLGCQVSAFKSIPQPSAKQLAAAGLADVPLAVALSGGLDSSIVAAAAARHHPGLLAFTFTLAPNGKDPEVEHAVGVEAPAFRAQPGQLIGQCRPPCRDLFAFAHAGINFLPQSGDLGAHSNTERKNHVLA